MEQWYLYTKKADFSGISSRFMISPIVARILRNRDIISDEQILQFLNPEIDKTYDPFLMKDMKSGIELVNQKINDGKKIRIIGDYDADGICSSIILARFFEHANAMVDVRLPDRISDGYGMNTRMVKEALEENVSLIITCDNGISCIEAVNCANEYGIDVIITDHHEPGSQIPDAKACIDAKQKDCNYPFKEICGAAVAYKFVQAYNIFFNTGLDELLDELLMYAGFATIADIVPLINENRIFAYQGIKRLRKTDDPGFCALMNARKIDKSKVNASTIGFVLAPCINSAGRLSDAGIAYDLLKCNDPSQAFILAEKLSALNEERKSLTTIQTEIALEHINKGTDSGAGDKILTVFLPDAHESLSGIIAGRLKEEYNRPAFVITRSAEGLKGSGRSIESYNMIAGLMKEPDLFIKFGGHPMACGFTLKDQGSEDETVLRFSQRMNTSCPLTDKDLIKRVWIDMELPFKYVSQELVDELKLLEPFGIGNEKPVFAGRNIRVINFDVLGVNRNVLKMMLEDQSGLQIEGIMFGNESDIAENYNRLADKTYINILFYPDINDFRGRRKPQVIIRSFN